MRGLATLVILFACAYFEFKFYPGHTYLRGSSQVLVPMLERLQSPGLLSRDIVATHPILNYTAFDELTLFLQRIANLNFATALALQQFAARLAGISGVYMLVRGIRIKRTPAVFIAALSGFGIFLPGVMLSTVDREPLPYAMALGYMLLALGFAASGKVLLCSLCSGLALLYSPGTAIPFWTVLLTAAFWKRSLKPALRPLLTALLVFGLLLGNLAQLQPEAAGALNWFGRIPDQWLHLMRTRTAATLVMTWAGREFWLYLAIYAAGACALRRIWHRLDEWCRWMFLAFPLAGLISIPLAASAQALTRSVLFTQTEPARAVLLTVVLTLILCSSAAHISITRRLWRETAIWSLCMVSLFALVLIRRKGASEIDFGSVRNMAAWAEQNTWGGSMFFFADAGRSLDPGAFRALSLRPVFIDWQSGELTRYSEDFANEWRSRWQEANEGECQPGNLPGLLDSPIDYYVLRRRLQQPNLRPVFADATFLVYDARDLRKVFRRLD